MNDPTAHSSEPDALPPDAIREPPHTFFKALRQIGPGLILAGSIVGTGELIATTGLGAKEGYILLWLILLSCVIKVFVQTELGLQRVDGSLRRGRGHLEEFEDLTGQRGQQVGLGGVQGQ